MTAIRRLAAILAADVAGYSRLMEADEEGTHPGLDAVGQIRMKIASPATVACVSRAILVKSAARELALEYILHGRRLRGSDKGEYG